MQPRPLTTLHVGGDITADGILKCGSLVCTGNATIGGSLTVTSLSVTNSLFVGGATTLSGGISTGRFIMQGPNAVGIATTASSAGSLEIQPTGGGASMISFHRPGAYAAYFGLDTDNVWRVGGWSAGANAYRLILGDTYPGANNGNVNTGQLSCTYLVTEGGDIGAGPLYFRHNGSYYIQFDNVNMFQAVNMNIMSWGSYYFSASPAIFIGSWDGTWIHTSHSIMMNGANLGFSNNGGVYWNYDGTWMRMYGTTGIGTSGTTFWLSNDASVGLYWDGTWLNIRPRAWAPNEMSCDVGIIRNGASGLRFTDDNVRIFRPTSTNQMKIYVYDAWCQWHRAYDNTSMGYVDIGGFHNPSSLKGKSNVAHIEDGLSLVRDQRIRPIRYTTPGYTGEYGHEDRADRRSVGLAAEDVDQVIPEVVGHDPETGEPTGINYGALVAVLWSAMRGLDARVDELEARLADKEAA